MFQSSEAFSSFSVNDIDAAEKFYGETLGLTLSEKTDMGGGMFGLTLTTGGSVMVYFKENHAPANFTVLNFPVADIDAAVDELDGKSVTFERYDGFEHDGKGIVRASKVGMGPDIAWFKDPAGNVLAVLQ